MKAEYDKETDALTITLGDARVKEGDEIRPGVIADFGYDGGVVGFEILQASKVVERAGERSRRDSSDIDGQTERPIWAGAHESVSIARVDGNAARVAGPSTGRASDQGKATTVGASDRGQ